MSQSDALQRFSFDGADVRGELLGLEVSIQGALAQQPYPEAIKHKLAELMAGAALLASMVKLKGRLSLQVQSNGPLRMLMAEISNNTDLRAVASKNPDTEWSQLTAETWPENARLALTLEPEGGKRYQGIVEMNGDSLAATIETYFAQSEQLPTKVWMLRSEQRLRALVLQRLPTSANADADAWERLVMLADTLKDDELLHLPNDAILHRLFHEETVRLYDPIALQFKCSCSKHRIGNALRQLGRKEIDEILLELGKVTLDCQFCGQHYSYNQHQIEELFAKNELNGRST
jgi:molecular chaperone Hsp33